MKKISAKVIIYIALGVELLDVVFKYVAIERLPEEGGRLSSPIDFALHKNPGIAFDIPIPLSIVIAITILITILLVKYAFRNWKTHQRSSAAALVTVIGALGNMIDRIVNNFTTDYIILFERSAINISDILIVFGAILLIYYTENKDA